MMPLAGLKADATKVEYPSTTPFVYCAGPSMLNEGADEEGVASTPLDLRHPATGLRL